ncbi:hypothetical protein GGS20DRAFT_582978 [Poronia punctata]|nr:hypothetical protein GGS20DRAFT_582978 [Poronia punctata]
MARSRSIVPWVALAAALVGATLVQSLEYCANFNAGETPKNSSIYQSNGLCRDFCNERSYAFAIIQAFDCFCGDYIPDPHSQVDTGRCNRACPGWPDETCGAKGLYQYILLDSQPSGTKSGEVPTPTRQCLVYHVVVLLLLLLLLFNIGDDDFNSPFQHSTSTIVETTSTTVSTVATTTSSSSVISTKSQPEKNPTGPASSSTAPGTTVKTVTAGGTVSIVTVIPTATPTTEPQGSKPEEKKSQGVGGGAIAGIIIGVLAIVGIIGLVVFFVRRRRQREEELGSRPGSHTGSAGVMSTPTTAMASVWDGDNNSTGRRNSRLMPHDPRMDPFATNIYSRFENKSRESINTLQDNQDYSRKVLRPTNPDPDDD